jgi:Ca-activated chloride channel family protein
MEHTVVAKKTTKGPLLLLCASVSLFICSTYGQCEDEVHIVPRNGSKAAASVAGTMPTDGPPRLNRQTRPLHVDVDLVLVPVTVSDSMNRPVVTLKKEDFALFEEDKPKEIRYFSAESAPVSVAILLDVSKSMSDKITAEREAIVEFFKNAHPDDEYFAIAFSDRPRVLASSVRSVDDVEQKLITVEPGGPTAMLDAVYLAVSELRSARYQRKAIVIVSDGGDNASLYTLREIKSLVQESDVQVYAIGLFDTFFFNTFEEKLGKKWLGEITDRTGGRTITVDDRTKIPEAAAELSREIRNEYVLGYRPTTMAKARWRRIKVQVTSSTDERRLRAYYRQGYLAAH